MDVVDGGDPLPSSEGDDFDLDFGDFAQADEATGGAGGAADGIHLHVADTSGEVAAGFAQRGSAPEPEKHAGDAPGFEELARSGNTPEPENGAEAENAMDFAEFAQAASTAEPEMAAGFAEFAKSGSAHCAREGC